MGVNIHVYTVYGVRLDWNDQFYQAYNNIEETLKDEFGYNNPIPEDRQIEIVPDYMSSRYIILGSILYDSGDFRYMDDMNDYAEFDPSLLLATELEYKERFARLYPEFRDLLDGKSFKLINIIQYS